MEKMGDRENLKPCPFCGGRPRLHPERAAMGAYVSCAGCGLEGPTETGTTGDDAIRYWNRRALTTAHKPLTADALITTIQAFLDADDATHWGEFEKALDAAINPITHKPVTDAMVDDAARALSQHEYPPHKKGDKFAWWWHPHFDKDRFAQENREDDRIRAKYALEAALSQPSDVGGEYRCPKCGAQADERYDCCEVHEMTQTPQGAEPAEWDHETAMELAAKSPWEYGDELRVRGFITTFKHKLEKHSQIVAGLEKERDALREYHDAAESFLSFAATQGTLDRLISARTALQGVKEAGDE